MNCKELEIKRCWPCQDFRSEMCFIEQYTEMISGNHIKISITIIEEFKAFVMTYDWPYHNIYLREAILQCNKPEYQEFLDKILILR